MSGTDASTLDGLVDALVAATADRVSPGRSGRIAIATGKTRAVGMEITDGRVVGPVDVDGAEVRIPVTAAQLAAFTAGDESLAQAYMRGDVKPEGSTRALLALVDVLEDDSVIDRVAGPT